MPARHAPLSGPQKVAVLLLQLGRERSSRVLRSLQDHEVAQVMTEVARLRVVDPEVADSVLGEFRRIAVSPTRAAAGGLEVACQLLEGSVDDDRVARIMQRVATELVDEPFAFLGEADAGEVVPFLEDEHPQTIALVLAHLAPQPAAGLMGALPADVQQEVAQRLATMASPRPEVVRQVDRALRAKLAPVQSAARAPVGGVGGLVDILNRADKDTERLILEGLERHDAPLAEEIRQRMFVFEDIASLDDRAVQLLLRQVDSKELALALKGVSEDVRKTFTKNMSQRAAANLLDEIDLLGPVRRATVEEARASIVGGVRALEEAGQLTLSRGGDDLLR